MDKRSSRSCTTTFGWGGSTGGTFLKVSGLGMAAAVIAACSPGASAKPSGAAGRRRADLGRLDAAQGRGPRRDARHHDLAELPQPEDASRSSPT